MGDGVRDVAEAVPGDVVIDPSSEPRGVGLLDSVGVSAPRFEDRKDMEPLGTSVVVSRPRLGREGALRCLGASGGLVAAG